MSNYNGGLDCFFMTDTVWTGEDIEEANNNPNLAMHSKYDEIQAWFTLGEQMFPNVEDVISGITGVFMNGTEDDFKKYSITM